MSARPAPPSRGFSLLELMVVLAILGVAASLSVAWLDRGLRRPLETAREQLQRDLAEAGRQAVQGQRLIGWSPGEAGYRFLAWRPRPGDGGHWQPLEAHLLPERRWPAGLSISRPDADTLASGTPAPDVPWVVWWPDGEVAGTTLVLHHEERRLVLSVGGAR